MIDILIKDILPILVIMALGWALGHAKFFDKDQQQGLNKFVLDLAPVSYTHLTLPTIA